MVQGGKLDAAAHTGAVSALEVSGLEVVYSDVIVALRGVDLAVPEGRIVALLGANGAGKTTLLRAVTGLLDLHRGRVVRGRVALRGRDITRAGASSIVRSGLAQVMEGRRIFGELTVDENLRTGAIARRDRDGVAASYEHVLELFPALKDRRRSVAGYLSGGEQQMVAIGRALMADPSVLLLDEPSLGLAPLIVGLIRDIVVQVNESGTTVLLVEQNATMALSIAHEGHVLEHGRVVKAGAGAELLADDDIREFYLGMGEAGRRSFRDVKTYRRKKRWGT